MNKVFPTFTGMAAVSWMLIAFLYAPLIVATLYAFSTRPLLTWPFEGWSLEWFAKVSADRQFRRAVWTSLEVALIASVLSTLIGTAAAFAFSRSSSVISRSVEGLSRLPVLLPGLFIGVGFVALMIATNIPPGRTMTVAAHVVTGVPWAVLVVSARLRTFDTDLESAARDLGASPVMVFQRVTLPIIAPAIIGAFLLGFAFSFDETLVTMFTAGQEITVPIFIVSKLRRVVDPTGNVVAVFLLVIPWISFALAAFFLRRSGGIGTILGSRL